MLVNSLILTFVITFCHASPTTRHHRREIRKNDVPVALAQTAGQHERTVPAPFTYGLWADDGKPCVYSIIDARVYVDYQTPKGQRRASVRTQPDADVKGHCRSLLNTNTQFDVLTPPGMHTRFAFKLNDDGSNFEMGQMKILYKLQDTLFPDSVSNETEVAEASPDSLKSFQNALLGHRCPSDMKLITTKGDSQVKIKFNSVRFEIFGVNLSGVNSTFSTPTNCAPEVAKTNAATSISKSGAIISIFVNLLLLITLCF